MSHDPGAEARACAEWLQALACYTGGSAPPLAPDSQAAFDALVPYLRLTVVYYDATAVKEVVEKYLHQRLPCAKTRIADNHTKTSGGAPNQQHRLPSKPFQMLDCLL